MNLYHALLLGLIAGLGTLTTLTDVRFGKIYNRHLVPFLVLGLTTHGWALLAFPESIPHVLRLLINSLLGLVFSAMLYAWRIWTAGDAKLFASFLFLMPMWAFRQAASNFFPGFAVLMNVFSAALLVVLGLNLRIGSNRRLTVPTFQTLRTWGRPWLRGIPVVSMVLMINLPLARWVSGWGVYDRLALLLAETVIATWVVRKRSNPLRDGILVLIAAFALAWQGGWTLDLSLIPLTALLLVVLQMVGWALIEKTPIDDLRPGRALSVDAVFGLKAASNSTLELPLPGHRLSIDDVERVKQIASKLGFESLSTVTVIPFAPFIFLGVLLQLAFHGYFLG